jgi:uncharacterized protein (DUF779 family)
MKARMRREMEAEKKAQDKMLAQAQAMQGPVEIEKDHSPVLQHVLYTCPDIGPAVFPKNEIDGYIHEFLLGQLAEEPEMSSAVMDMCIKHVVTLVNGPSLFQQDPAWLVPGPTFCLVPFSLLPSHVSF